MCNINISSHLQLMLILARNDSKHASDLPMSIYGLPIVDVVLPDLDYVIEHRPLEGENLALIDLALLMRKHNFNEGQSALLLLANN